MTYIVTQSALDDAPTRYTEFVQEAIQYIEDYPLPYESDGSGCHDTWWIDGPDAVKDLTLVPGSLSAHINDDNSVTVNAVVDTVISVPAHYTVESKILFICISDTVCSGTIVATTQITMSVIFHVEWDPATGSLAITPEANVDVPEPSLVGCSVPGWVKWFVDVDAKIQEAVDEVVAEVIAEICQRVNVPQTVSPYDGIYVWYNVSDLVFEGGDAVVVASDCKVIATVTEPGAPPVNLTYDDLDPEDAHMRPPMDWNRTASSAEGELRLLNGLRLSSTLVTALMWAADVSGAFNESMEANVLDATLVFNLTWSRPWTSVPNDDILRINIGYGKVNGTCGTAGEGLGTTMLDFSFTNLQALGSIEYTGDDAPGIMIQLSTVDLTDLNVSLKAPPIPLPTDVIESVLKDFVNDSIPQMNDYLAAHPYYFPPAIAENIPNPVIEVVHQSDCCSGGHGYANLRSYCLCQDSSRSRRALRDDPPWIPCQFSCGGAEMSGGAETPEVSVEVTLDHKMVADVVLPGAASVSQRRLSLSPLREFRARPRVVDAGDGLIVSAFFSTNQTVNRDCSLGLPGDTLTSTFLASTGGDCAPLGVADYSYLLNLDTMDVGLLCDDACGMCYFRETVKRTQCYAIQDEGSLVFLDKKCLGILFFSSLYLVVGGAVAPPADAPFWLLANRTKSCNTSRYATQNLGHFNSCSQIDASDPEGYAYAVKVDDGTYVVAWQCLADCVNCSAVVANVVLNQCLGLAPGLSAQLFTGASMDICASPVPKPPEPSTGGGIDFPTTEVVVGGLLLAFAAVCVIYRRQVRAFCTPICRSSQGCARECGSSARLLFVMWVRSVEEWFSSTLGCPPATRRDKAQGGILLLIALCLGIESVLWITDDPFTLFYSDALDEIGLGSDNSINTTYAQDMFKLWSTFGQLITAGGGCFVLLCIFARAILLRPTDPMKWHSLRTWVLSLVLVSQVLIILFPPLVYMFNESIVVEYDPDDWLTQDKETRDELSEGLGYAFAGVAFSYLANMFLYMIHGASFGFFIIILCFCWRLDFPSFLLLDKSTKLAFLTRLSAVTCISQLLGPVACALPVIIVYQSIGVNVLWIAAWGVLWFGGMVSYFHFRSILVSLYAGIRTQRVGPLLQNHVRRQVGINAAAFSITCLSLTAYTLAEEATFPDMSVTFPSILFCSLATVTSGLTYFVLARLACTESPELEIRGYVPLLDAPGRDGPVIVELSRSQKASALESTLASNLVSQLESESAYRQELLEKHDSDTQAGWACSQLCGYLSERREHLDPTVYGKRVVSRRIFLVFGCLFYTYIVFDTLQYLVSTTVKEAVVDFFASLDMDMQWPSDDDGGTLFDDAFDTYNVARWVQFGFMTVALIGFFCSLACDLLYRSKIGLHRSRLCGYVSVAFLVVSVICTAFPNYLRGTHIEELCPSCAPEFDNMLHLLCGDLVGMFCAAVFTMDMLAVLVAVTPSLIRACFLLLYNEKRHLKTRKNFRITSVLSVFLFTSLYTPVISGLPLIVGYQLVGDWVIGTSIGIMWLLPSVVASRLTLWNSGTIYLSWMGAYLGTLLFVFVYYWVRYGLASYVLDALQDGTLYVEVAAEVCLANVVLSDLLYHNQFYDL